MKQMNECLDRFFKRLKPDSKKKWQAHRRNNLLLLYHYSHYVLGYDTEKNTIFHEWWEYPADKRGLEAAKEYLERRKLNEMA